MKSPRFVLLPVLLLALAFTNCSDGDGGGGGGSSGGTDFVKGDGTAAPDANVQCSDVKQCLSKGVESLKAENWDEAVAYYNNAYAKDNNDPEAIIYSTLANLAKISTDANVVALIKNNFGFTKYPNKLNALFSTDWMQKMPEDYPIDSYYDGTYWSYWIEAEYYDVSKDGYYRYDYNSGAYILVSTVAKYDSTWLPVISTPDWVKGSGSMYNKALLSGNVMGAEAWAIALLANILERNSNGFNNTLDEVIAAVFGASYTEATNRLAKLEKTKTINLDPYFIRQLDLEDIFDTYDEIGWAELNAVMSATLALKASLEWLSSYDLNTNLNWLKFAWPNDEDAFVKQLTNNLKSVSVSDLPFKNNFLNARSDGAAKMEKAKNTYKKAIQGLQESYTVIQNNPLYPTEIKNAYATVNGGFNALIGAIDGDSKFYFPEDPTKGTWPTSKTNNVVATIDFGKFFELGRFSLSNIFETDGKNPVLYACYWHYDPTTYTDELKGDKLTVANYSTLLQQEDYWGDKYELCLKADMTKIKSIVDASELDEELEGGLISTDIEGDLAKAIFEKYYK